MSNYLAVQYRSSAVVIRFLRPEIRSPLSQVVLAALENVLAEIEASRGLEKVVFTGTDGVFASGADLRDLAEIGNNAKAFAERGQRIMDRIVGLSQRTIAAVNGYCFGGALDLALACRSRVASPAAVFAHPGANLGIMTGWGGSQRLPRLIGEARALEIFLEARRVGATEALQWGLVDLLATDAVACALSIDLPNAA